MEGVDDDASAFMHLNILPKNAGKELNKIVRIPSYLKQRNF